jgi:hypothetical protein
MIIGANNAITEQLAEALPRIDAMLDETRGTQWFTEFDFAQGYHWFDLEGGFVEDKLDFPTKAI